MSEQAWEWNVCRRSDDGELWDIYEDEWVTTHERAIKDAQLWWDELDDPKGDPVVVIRRTARVQAGEWQVFESTGEPNV